MVSIKKRALGKLIQSLGKCCNLHRKNGKDYSLINFYYNEKITENISSIWTDWFKRLDSNILVIGQDWESYNDMLKLHNEYMKEPTS